MAEDRHSIGETSEDQGKGTPQAAEGNGRAAQSLPLTISRPELLVDGSDRQFRRLVHSLFGFLARHERIRAGHAGMIGLSGIQYTVLISIAHLSYDGEVHVKAVASHLHLSGAFITSVVGELLDKGLVHKRTSAQDRRHVSLSVSEEGHTLLERLAPTQREVNDVEFACLSREDAEYLLCMMERLIECGDEALALQQYFRSRRGG